MKINQIKFDNSCCNNHLHCKYDKMNPVIVEDDDEL